MGNILDLQHKLVRRDPYTIELANAIELSLNEINSVIDNLKLQMSFKTMTWYADILAEEMGLKLPADMPIDEARSVLESRWKNNGKSDAELLKSIASSWDYGEVEVYFVDGKIVIEFISDLGIRSDVGNLAKAIDLAKPAHLIVGYQINNILVNPSYTASTLIQNNQYTLTSDINDTYSLSAQAINNGAIVDGTAITLS